jgi:hypothetical protein
MFRRNHGRIFPNSAASTQLLNASYHAVMPGIIAKGEDGQWDMHTASKTNNGDLGNNGTIAYGTLGNSLMLYVQKPDDIPLETFYRDSKAQMDLLLRGIAIYRPVGVEKIKITSVGKAAQDETFVDAYQRRWMVRVWNVPYNDQQMVLFALPVPGGIAGMLRMVPTFRTVGHVGDLRALADFFYVSYYGTLAQWRELLAQRDRLPPVFHTLTIDFEYSRHFRYASKRVAFSYSPEQMQIGPRSDMELRFAYFREDGKIVWDVSRVIVGEDRDRATYFSVNRDLRPPNELSDKLRARWEKIAQRRHPYNRTAFFDDKRTLIGDVYVSTLRQDQVAAAPLLYTTFYGTDGNVDQRQVESKLKGFIDNLSVREY